jgi:hypothetical protein
MALPRSENPCLSGYVFNFDKGVLAYSEKAFAETTDKSGLTSFLSSDGKLSIDKSLGFL